MYYRTPVWTAFITHLLVSRTWLIRRSPALVCLRELRRHIFSSEYDPQLSPGGEHFLKFSFEAGRFSFPSFPCLSSPRKTAERTSFRLTLLTDYIFQTPKPLSKSLMNSPDCMLGQVLILILRRLCNEQMLSGSSKQWTVTIGSSK